ncbi:hypothetical protein SPRG_12372 [Saprolegnia parasitica CBS 223.65]|uniref:Uncharacterized protein n=1 Tax=Saprolegnia parasitica (strain CBS 223.65) TaxID=695850 RepID=A0A067BYE4_SAPPC|nr:hypothetical protein SPRG_12372 [Saprolegnia parasitica CBS 223.65]KDO21870.1 hypothetical protein SPRG_12372 [Saprolegnia parasitica CBS 223.65]|eukprot:XP_012207425.1 hypothetical protein SPRG_12372 [Saprolegnia parasitica CBS 223.65]
MGRWTPELVEAVVLYLERPRDVLLVLASLPLGLLTLPLQCVAQLTEMAVVDWPDVHLDETAIDARSLALLAGARRLDPSITVNVQAGDAFQRLLPLLAGCITRVHIPSAVNLPAGLSLQAALAHCTALRHLSLYVPSTPNAVSWLKPLLQRFAEAETLSTLDLRFGRDAIPLIQSCVFAHVAHWLRQPSARVLACRGDVSAEEALWSALGGSPFLTDLVLESPRLLARPTPDYRMPCTLRSLRWKALHECSMVPVAAILRSAPRLSSLALSWGHLPPSPLVMVVRDLRCLVSVSFSGNRLGSKVFPPILQAIGNLPLLKSLSLADNQLADSAVPHLLRVLAACSVLRTLDVSQNAIAATGLASLLPALAKKPTLAQIKLETTVMCCATSRTSRRRWLHGPAPARSC